MQSVQLETYATAPEPDEYVTLAYILIYMQKKYEYETTLAWNLKVRTLHVVDVLIQKL